MPHEARPAAVSIARDWTGCVLREHEEGVGGDGHEADLQRGDVARDHLRSSREMAPAVLG